MHNGTAPNGLGTALASIVKTPFGYAKEYFHRRPDPSYAPNFVTGEAKERAGALVEEMRREGIVLLPGYFKQPLLGKLQGALDRAVSGHPDKGNPNAFSNLNSLEADATFYDAALDDFLLEVIGGYYQKRFAVTTASAMRLLPAPSELRTGSFQWHHDTRGRQVHVMVLLSDVTTKGQRMTYLKRSHNTYYNYARSKDGGSRFEVDVVSNPSLKERIAEVVGPAGTVAIFDSNGLHSGNRGEGEIRETLTLCYVSWRHFKKVRVKRKDIEALPPQKRQVMEFNPNLVWVD